MQKSGPVHPIIMLDFGQLNDFLSIVRILGRSSLKAPFGIPGSVIFN